MKLYFLRPPRTIARRGYLMVCAGQTQDGFEYSRLFITKTATYILNGLPWYLDAQITVFGILGRWMRLSWYVLPEFLYIKLVHLFLECPLFAFTKPQEIRREKT